MLLDVNPSLEMVSSFLIARTVGSLSMVNERDGEWHQYMIFVETGISSSSVTLSLNAGSDTSAKASSTVFFVRLVFVDNAAYQHVAA